MSNLVPDNQIDRMVELYANGKGLSILQIADKLKYGKTTVHRYLCARGVKCVRRSPGRAHTFDIDAAWMRYQATGDYKLVAREFGKSVNCMRRALTRRAAKLKKLAGE